MPGKSPGTTDPVHPPSDAPVLYTNGPNEFSATYPHTAPLQGPVRFQMYEAYSSSDRQGKRHPRSRSTEPLCVGLPCQGTRHRNGFSCRTSTYDFNLLPWLLSKFRIVWGGNFCIGTSVTQYLKTPPSFSEGFWFSDSAPTPFILAVVTDSFHASDILAKAPVNDDEFSCRARSYDLSIESAQMDRAIGTQEAGPLSRFCVGFPCQGTRHRRRV